MTCPPDLLSNFLPLLLPFLSFFLLFLAVLLAYHDIDASSRKSDHFRNIAARGGELEEIDPMTTTAGVLDLFTKNEYVK